MSRTSFSTRFWRAWERTVPMPRNFPFWGTVIFLGVPTLGAMYLGNAPMFPDEESIKLKQGEWVTPRTPELPGNTPMEQRMYYRRKYDPEAAAAEAEAEAQAKAAKAQSQQAVVDSSATAAAVPASKTSKKASQQVADPPITRGIRFGASGTAAPADTAAAASADSSKGASDVGSGGSGEQQASASERRPPANVLGTRIDPEGAEEVSLFGRTYADVLRAAAGR